MSGAQREAGQSYYVAISLHNAAQTMLAAGRYDEARRLGRDSLAAFEEIPHADVEKFSTYAVLAVAAFETGDAAAGEMHIRSALSSGLERGDVHSECAQTLAVIGDFGRASQLLLSASDLEASGRSDLGGKFLHTFTQTLMAFAGNSDDALTLLLDSPESMPLDTGFVLERQMLIAEANILAGDSVRARELAQEALNAARMKGANRLAARLGVVLALAKGDVDEIRNSVSLAASHGELALLTVADAIGASLFLTPDVPSEIRESIAKWPRRWLPILRRQLNDGGTPNAAVAARLIDEFGEASDLIRLKAFAKTYRKVTRPIPALGARLTRRVAASLDVLDLGRTSIRVGERVVEIGAIRRKSAALLMFLVTRPGFTANREQTLEELWPETDPVSAANNLNQALYFLRREIDPWYEDDLSVEYVGFQGDLVWLDATLTKVASVEFAANARKLTGHALDPVQALAVVSAYSGQFSPEFEYEEWAISWRTRVHAMFLELANATAKVATQGGHLELARDVALLGLDRDPQASDIEQKLVWLYWHMGSQSAAVAHYEHLRSPDEGDGFEVVTLSELVRGELP